MSNAAPEAEKMSRKQQILQALAHMLEVHPGELITTAGLAKEVGVSEAALYLSLIHISEPTRPY